MMAMTYVRVFNLYLLVSISISGIYPHMINVGFRPSFWYLNILGGLRSYRLIAVQKLLMHVTCDVSATSYRITFIVVL